MAKKAAKRSHTKKPEKKAPARKRTTPRSQVLPGMEQVRDAAMDQFCESIGEGRERKNLIIVEENADLQGALRRMHDKGYDVYRHAGLELVRVPGEEKLRCRTTKEKASDITVEDEGTETER